MREKDSQPKEKFGILDYVTCANCGSKIPINLLSNLPPIAEIKCPFCGTSLYKRSKITDENKDSS